MSNAETRTLQVVSVCNVLVSSGDDGAWRKVSIQGTHFPVLKGHLSRAVQWRIRSAQVMWEPLDSSSTKLVGMFLTQTGASWAPQNFHDFKTRGGVFKPLKNTGWSSNTLPSSDIWVDSSAGAAELYTLVVPAPTVDAEIGMITLRATIQLKGWHE